MGEFLDLGNLTEKQKIEFETAKIFLRLYNKQKQSAYEVIDIADKPDVICKDLVTNKIIELEITLLEDRPGDISYLLGRGLQEPNFTPSFVIDFRRNVFPRLIGLLNNKLLSNYGSTTALVIRQVGPLWSAAEWIQETMHLRSEVFAGREENYGLGVWILCSNTSVFPAENDLVDLYDPEAPPRNADLLPPPDRVVGKATWEDAITADFTSFTQQTNVDPPIRIKSPHDCEKAILIAFDKGEPDEWRRYAIEFYKAQMLFYCPCGKGTATLLGNWV